MDYKKSKSTVKYGNPEMFRNFGKILVTSMRVLSIIAKRANQISVEIKQDLSKKLAEFAS